MRRRAGSGRAARGRGAATAEQNATAAHVWGQSVSVPAQYLRWVGREPLTPRLRLERTSPPDPSQALSHVSLAVPQRSPSPRRAQ